MTTWWWPRRRCARRSNRRTRSARKKISQLNEFIARFAAGTRSSQVQSRRKEVERLQVTELAKSNIAAPFHQVRTEAAFGQAHSGSRAPEQGLRRQAGDPRLHRQHHARRKNRAHGAQRSGQDHAGECAAGEFADHAGSRAAQDQRLRRPFRRFRQSALGARSIDRIFRAGPSQPDRRRHDRAGVAASVESGGGERRNSRLAGANAVCSATKRRNPPAFFPVAKPRACSSAS